MSSSAGRLPKPTPIDTAAMQPPAPPPRQTSGTFRIVTLAPQDQLEIGFVYKRTYALDAKGRPVGPADQQPPLEDDGASHEPLTPSQPPSCKSLPEVIGFKTGTDIVVRGSARPPHPTREHTVAVKVGPHVHAARVFGPRRSEFANGQIRFTPPVTFEVMPLRLEHAYGGRDAAFEASLLEEVAKGMTPEAVRRARPSVEAVFGANHPFMYPRNRHGKGYVLARSAASIDGRELPTIERPDDLLTPERLVLAHPLDWTVQPVPAAFDYIDAFTFPRSALLGFPPPSARPLDRQIPEVVAGLLPDDFTRGNLMAVRPQDMASCLHPWATRCAPPGLCLPFLSGTETIVLSGMDPATPELAVPLPRERPEVTLPEWLRSEPVLHGELHLVFLDVDARSLSLIWSQRTRLGRTILPAHLVDVSSAARLRMTGL
jgi:hypothetical protein